MLDQLLNQHYVMRLDLLFKGPSILVIQEFVVQNVR